MWAMLTAMLCLRSRPKSVPGNHAERQANTHMLAKFSLHVLHTDSRLFRMKWMVPTHSILTFPLLLHGCKFL